MAERTLTIIDEETPTEVEARVDGERIFLSPEALKAATGWEVKPMGLCRGDRCVGLPAEGSPVTDDGIELAGLARLVRHPFAVDLEEGVAALAAPAEQRAGALQSLEAPDFTLPDLDGNEHSLSDYRGKKVLLAAYASW